MSARSPVSLRSWLSLSMGVLVVSGLMALLIALARTPMVRPFLPPSYFRVALVSHVDLLLVVWYLVVPVLLWSQSGLLAPSVERLAFGAILVGAGAVAASGAAGLGEAVLAHYVPFLVDPVFLAGLVVFLAGVAVAAGAAGLGRGPTGAPEERAAAAAALCILGAILTMAVAGARAAGSVGGPGSAALVSAFWAGGHLLQFGHVAGMIAAWAVLLRGAGARGRGLEVLAWAGYLCVAGVAVGILASLVVKPEELAGGVFTSVKAWGVGVPGAVAALAAGWLWLRGERGASGVAAVPAGILVLGLGGVIALVADLGVQTTLIPGHYHAELTAVALAYMGYTISSVVRGGVRLEGARLANWQPYLYGVGTVILVGGMALAGLYGAPRKTAGIEFARDAATLRALAIWGIGAIMAVVGGGAYVLGLFATLLRWRPAEGEAAGAVTAVAGGRSAGEAGR